MGPSQGSPVRHVHYPNPGANYNPMSPTNQGVYVYGEPPMSQYPMQSYNMPPMNTLPVHMMTPLPNPEQQSSDPSIQGQENISCVSIPGPGMVSLYINFYKRLYQFFINLCMSLINIAFPDAFSNDADYSTASATKQSSNRTPTKPSDAYATRAIFCG